MNGLTLRLPNLTEGEPESQLRQLRSYLYQLTEQLQIALGSREETPAAQDPQTLLREAVALSAKRGDGRYVGLEALEGPWRQQSKAIEALQAQAAALPEQEKSALPQQALCRAGNPGVQLREGDTVRFLPLPPWTYTADGHWQIL